MDSVLNNYKVDMPQNPTNQTSIRDLNIANCQELKEIYVFNQLFRISKMQLNVSLTGV